MDSWYFLKSLENIYKKWTGHDNLDVRSMTKSEKQLKDIVLIRNSIILP